jgi:hypothetical protein
MIENAYSYMLEAASREARRRETSAQNPKTPSRQRARTTTSQVTMRSEHGNTIVVRRTKYSTDIRSSEAPVSSTNLRIACLREAWADRLEVLEEHWARRAAECKHVLDAYLAVAKTPSKAGAVHELNRYRERDGGFMSEMDVDLDITKYFLKRILNHMPTDPLYNKIRLVRASKKHKRPSRTAPPAPPAQTQKNTYDTWGEP